MEFLIPHTRSTTEEDGKAILHLYASLFDILSNAVDCSPPHDLPPVPALIRNALGATSLDVVGGILEGIQGGKYADKETVEGLTNDLLVLASMLSPAECTRRLYNSGAQPLWEALAAGNLPSAVLSSLLDFLSNVECGEHAQRPFAEHPTLADEICKALVHQDFNVRSSALGMLEARAQSWFPLLITENGLHQSFLCAGLANAIARHVRSTPETVTLSLSFIRWLMESRDTWKPELALAFYDQTIAEPVSDSSIAGALEIWMMSLDGAGRASDAVDWMSEAMMRAVVRYVESRERSGPSKALQEYVDAVSKQPQSPASRELATAYAELLGRAERSGADGELDFAKAGEAKSVDRDESERYASGKGYGSGGVGPHARRSARESSQYKPRVRVASRRNMRHRQQPKM
ncbi:hypothetical protein FRB99_008060 [Tulasnella sp. 403]|nr:hypothetical protein FRB99_008060 [Tulasnella sp. 403]